MTELDRYFGGQFLTKLDVSEPVAVTIASTDEHEFPDDDRPKLVLNWTTPDVKPLLCNATNVQVLRALFDVSDSRELQGKTVEIYVDQSVRNPAGQIVGGLRLRAPTREPIPGTLSSEAANF
jgi:hypothetical protein